MMGEEYKLDMQEASMAESDNCIEIVENCDPKDFVDLVGDDGYENEENHRGRGAFRYYFF